MEILGVGPLELLFIFLIALIVLGPKDMAKTGRTLGRFMYKVVTSPTWQTFRQASRDLRQLPTKLMREAGLEEQELKKLSQEIGLKDVDVPISRQDLSLSSWTTPTAASETSSTASNSSESPVEQTTPEQSAMDTENSIAPAAPNEASGSSATLEGAADDPAATAPPEITAAETPGPVETQPESSTEVDPHQETETR